MLAIFGWIICAVFIIKITIGFFFLGVMNFGKYNIIGGGVNTFRAKFWTAVSWAITAYLWYLLVTNAPFTINLS